MPVDSDPLAYFITWTVYGTFLQGDGRWWSKRRKGEQAPQPRLEQWHAGPLKHSVLLLSAEDRSVVEGEVRRHCDVRRWKLWRVNPRTNHVHAVVTASDHSGRTVRDQLKANCTRGLRERSPRFRDRPIWSAGGDWACINGEDDLEQVLIYSGEAQDRMDRE